MRKIVSNDFPERSLERLYLAIMDPCLFSIKNSSLATVAKLSRKFDDEMDKLLLDSVSKNLMRVGAMNITVDTKAQRDLFLVANFGVDTECTDIVPYNQLQGEFLMDTLTHAKEELTHFKPPIPTLQCTYKEFDSTNKNRQIVKVSDKISFIFKDYKLTY